MVSTDALMVDDLSVKIATEEFYVSPTENISFGVKPGCTVAVVGESGSGKSTLGLAIMDLLSGAATHISGTVFVNGRQVVGPNIGSDALRRGSDISMVFQNPNSALNPLKTVGKQLCEAIKAYQPRFTKDRLHRRSVEMLSAVGLHDSENLIRAYPHELSGGMVQRVMIAMAVVNNPAILIADEPTTALDVTIQRQVLNTLKSVQDSFDMSVLFITHDVRVVEDIADSVIVMYAGKIVERGAVNDVLKDPKHPYTRALLQSVPEFGKPPSRNAILPGRAAGASDRPTGCSFHPRCEFASEVCSRQTPELREFVGGHEVACHHAETIDRRERTTSYGDNEALASGTPKTTKSNTESGVLSPEKPILVAESLVKRYGRRGRFGRRSSDVTALNNVSLELFPGTTLGIVGESGSGKTTLARSLVNLVEPDSGNIVFDGINIGNCSERELHRIRRDIQFVFQNPGESLDPRWSVEKIISEPLRNSRLAVHERESIITRVLSDVDLSVDDIQRRPSEFSGGEQQRIAIARALVTRPKIIILDEPTSSLDVSVQAKIVAMLRNLQDEYGLTYVFVTHDLILCSQISHDVIVMKSGRVVERDVPERLYKSPREAYTKKLLSAVPGLEVY